MDPTLGEWAATAGALFAAIAAGAAWRSARQGRQALEAAERPLVEVQVLAEPGTRMLLLAIINTGRGVARGVNFAVHALGHVTDNVIGDGYMQPGERVHVVTDIGPLPTPAGQMRADLADLGVMLAYRDGQGFVHYRTHTGEHRTPRTRIRRRPKYPERVETFKRLYPHIDIDGATRANNVVSRPDALAVAAALGTSPSPGA
jgi:hypothetical protein